jgi:hypothetical protein
MRKVPSVEVKALSEKGFFYRKRMMRCVSLLKMVPTNENLTTRVLPQRPGDPAVHGANFTFVPRPVVSCTYNKLR